ncbi:glycosyltransferase [Candidatus Pacearchaeota archaeon]|nr:glycosyltransferase [Candidatus Pacearchaeota archaeon]
MLSIIIPAHNEEKRIGPTLEAYANFFSEKKKQEKVEYEIIVVNNASRDNTISILKKYSRRFKEIKYLDLKDGGKGYAVLEGFKVANGDFIGFVDADMSTPQVAFYDLYKNIRNYDGLIASRWLENSKTKRTFGKYIRSIGFNYLVRSLFFFPYRDTQCGAKVFRKHVIEEVASKVKSIKWAFDVNLLYLCRKKGFQIKEHPTLWYDKEGSKVSSKVPLQMAAAVIRLRLVHSLFNFIVRFYDKMPEKIKFHH